MQVGNFNLKTISPRQRCRCLFSKLLIIFLHVFSTMSPHLQGNNSCDIKYDSSLHTCICFCCCSLSFFFLRKPKNESCKFHFRLVDSVGVSLWLQFHSLETKWKWKLQQFWLTAVCESYLQTRDNDSKSKVIKCTH